MRTIFIESGNQASWLLVAQVFACFFMTGLIWLVQVVHYPGFQFTDERLFARYHFFHSQRITWIVFPIMTLELISALALGLLDAQVFWIANLAGVVGIWLATGLVSVPLHNRLAQGSTPEILSKLVTTNWIRTVLWSLRSAALVFFLAARICYPLG